MGFNPIKSAKKAIKNVTSGKGLFGQLGGGIDDPDLSVANKAVAAAIADMKKSFDAFEKAGKSFVDAGFDANQFIQDPEGHMDTFRSNTVSAGIVSRAKKLGGTPARTVTSLQERAGRRQGAVVEQEQFQRGLQNAQLGQQLLAQSQQADPTQLRLTGLTGIGQAQADALQAQNVKTAALIQGAGTIGLTAALNPDAFRFGQQSRADIPIPPRQFGAGQLTPAPTSLNAPVTATTAPTLGDFRIGG